MTSRGGDVPGAEVEQTPAEAQHAQKKMAMATAWLDYTNGDGSLEDFKAQEQAFFGGQVPTGLVHPHQCIPKCPTPRAKHILGVKHAGQNTSYYCGPASGLMIMRYPKIWHSRSNGIKLNQKHMAGPAHMRTRKHGATRFTKGDFRRGLNRWRQGTTSGFYVRKNSPSQRKVKAALRYDIDRSMPFGVSTLEWAGGKHYNHHPKRQTIGHWLAARGYSRTLKSIHMQDPSTTLWPDAKRKIHPSTRRFTHKYVNLNGHGIVW